MSRLHDALKSKGRIKLSEALDGMRSHVKVKHGKVEFTPPQDLEEPMAGMLQQSVKALNDLVAIGLVKVDADGRVEVK